MSSPPPTGLLPSEVAALRRAAGVDVADFGRSFGVAPNVVERWEEFGVPTGPTALALRLVASSMDFEFPAPEALSGEQCSLCGAPATEVLHGLPLCPPCHRAPEASLGALGFVVQKSYNHVSNLASVQVELPAGKEMPFTGRFLSEGLGTMLTKLFKDEPQIGEPRWDDAVYVQWIEPGLQALDEEATRELVRALVFYGMLDVAPCTISVQQIPNWAGSDAEIVLLSGLLASRQP